MAGFESGPSSINFQVAEFCYLIILKALCITATTEFDEKCIKFGRLLTMAQASFVALVQNQIT